MDYLAHIARESAAFRTAIAAADPATRVPTCPDWSTVDLLAHLAGVQHFWATIVRDRRQSIDGLERPERPPTIEGAFEFFDRATEELQTSLSSVADDEPLWTWHPDARHAGFIKRRQALEAVIHRLDAELLTGSRTSIDPELATDGVDEAITIMFGGVPPWATLTDEGVSGEVVAQNADVRWLVRVDRWSGTSPDGETYEDELALTPATDPVPQWSLRASASDLHAWFWQRPTIAPVDHTGDTEPIAAVIASGLQ